MSVKIHGFVWAAIALSGLFFSTSPAAASRFRGRRGPSPPISVTLTVGAMETRTSSLRFTGTPRRYGQPETVSATGAQLGLTRPVVADVALHLDGDAHHVAFGGVFGIMLGGRGGTPMPGVPASRDGTLTGFYVGPELATVWSVRFFDVRAGVSLGYRSYSFPIIGFDTEPCGKNQASRCAPSVTNTGFFLRPVLALGGHTHGVSFGAYAGGDVMPGGGWSAGTYVGIDSDTWRTQAAIGAPN